MIINISAKHYCHSFGSKIAPSSPRARSVIHLLVRGVRAREKFLCFFQSSSWSLPFTQRLEQFVIGSDKPIKSVLGGLERGDRHGDDVIIIIVTL